MDEVVCKTYHEFLSRLEHMRQVTVNTDYVNLFSSIREHNITGEEL